MLVATPQRRGPILRATKAGRGFGVPPTDPGQVTSYSARALACNSGRVSDVHSSVRLQEAPPNSANKLCWSEGERECDSSAKHPIEPSRVSARITAAGLQWGTWFRAMGSEPIEPVGPLGVPGNKWHSRRSNHLLCARICKLPPNKPEHDHGSASAHCATTPCEGSLRPPTGSAALCSHARRNAARLHGRGSGADGTRRISIAVRRAVVGNSARPVHRLNRRRTRPQSNPTSGPQGAKPTKKGEASWRSRPTPSTDVHTQRANYAADAGHGARGRCCPTWRRSCASASSGHTSGSSRRRPPGKLPGRPDTNCSSR